MVTLELEPETLVNITKNYDILVIFTKSEKILASIGDRTQEQQFDQYSFVEKQNTNGYTRVRTCDFSQYY